MIDNKKKLLYVFDSGPYSNSSGSETLEAVLVGTNFEQDISLLFINNGLLMWGTDAGRVAGKVNKFGYKLQIDKARNDGFYEFCGLRICSRRPSDKYH